MMSNPSDLFVLLAAIVTPIIGSLLTYYFTTRQQKKTDENALTAKTKADEASIQIAKIESATDILPGLMTRLNIVEGKLDVAEASLDSETKLRVNGERRIEFLTELVTVLIKQNVGLLLNGAAETASDSEREEKFKLVLSTAMVQTKAAVGHDGAGFRLD